MMASIVVCVREVNNPVTSFRRIPRLDPSAQPTAQSPADGLRETRPNPFVPTFGQASLLPSTQPSVQTSAQPSSLTHVRPSSQPSIAIRSAIEPNSLQSTETPRARPQDSHRVSPVSIHHHSPPLDAAIFAAVETTSFVPLVAAVGRAFRAAQCSDNSPEQRSPAHSRPANRRTDPRVSPVSPRASRRHSPRFNPVVSHLLGRASSPRGFQACSPLYNRPLIRRCDRFSPHVSLLHSRQESRPTV
jgi:hypothetical protein